MRHVIISFQSAPDHARDYVTSCANQNHPLLKYIYFFSGGFLFSMNQHDIVQLIPSLFFHVDFASLLPPLSYVSSLDNEQSISVENPWISNYTRA